MALAFDTIATVSARNAAAGSAMPFPILSPEPEVLDPKPTQNHMALQSPVAKARQISIEGIEPSTLSPNSRCQEQKLPTPATGGYMSQGCRVRGFGLRIVGN